MARPRNSIPALKFHKSTRQFYLFWGGKRHYLGRNKIDAEARYKAFIGQSGQTENIPPIPHKLTVAQALDLFVQRDIHRYNDRRTRQRLLAAIEAACEQHAAIPVSMFAGRALREVRSMLVARISRKGKPLTRRYVNHLIDALLIVFRWLVANEYVPDSNLATMQAQARDLAEHGGGRESDPIVAVDDWVVDATLPFCSPGLRAMIEFHRETGMRPGEVVDLTRGEISTSPKEKIVVAGLGKEVQAFRVNGRMIWLAAPSKHKNLHRKKPRVVAIGPEAQRIITPLLFGLSPSDRIFIAAKGGPYSVTKYDQALHDAIAAANEKRKKPIPYWTPNQLRKAAAQEADAALDSDKAGAMLGHSPSRRALDHYIKEQIAKAAEAAAKVG